METTPAINQFDATYESGSPPWVIGAPQPAIAELVAAGQIRGSVLDLGCGTGEHTILLTREGYDAVGADLSAPALRAARENAAAKGVPARFESMDALNLAGPPRFDTVLDSALFHIFDTGDQVRYLRSLENVAVEGAVLYVLSISADNPPRWEGPRNTAEEIRAAAKDTRWTCEAIEVSRYRVPAPEWYTGETTESGQTDMLAWLARFTRG